MQRQALIEQRINATFSVDYLELLNESHNHRGGENAQTHFKCVLVSSDFVGKRAVQRHQMVYALVTDEMEKGLHALALHLYTPEEWSLIQQAPDSPACQHKK